MNPKYPHVEVQLTNEDGNAFFILGKVRSELKRAGVPAAELDEFHAEATADDYDHLLRTCMKWVSVK